MSEAKKRGAERCREIEGERRNVAMATQPSSASLNQAGPPQLLNLLFLFSRLHLAAVGVCVCLCVCLHSPSVLDGAQNLPRLEHAPLVALVVPQAGGNKGQDNNGLCEREREMVGGDVFGLG